MDFKTYQSQTAKTAIYPKGFVYPALGLSGEAGEVAEQIKKTIRDDEGQLSDKRRKKLKKELGDVLWYVSQLCTELELDMGEVAEANLEKLNKRMKEGKIQGEGSDR